MENAPQFEQAPKTLDLDAELFDRWVVDAEKTYEIVTISTNKDMAFIPDNCGVIFVKPDGDKVAHIITNSKAGQKVKFVRKKESTEYIGRERN